MSNVLRFRAKPAADNSVKEKFELQIVAIDGEVDEVLVPMELTIDEKERLALITFTAAWWLARDLVGSSEDPSRDLLCQVALHRGGGVRVFAPGNDHVDSFATEEQVAWLRRRFTECHAMALPSWSEERPACGTTSQLHSANSDQLQFSW